MNMERGDTKAIGFNLASDADVSPWRKSVHVAGVRKLNAEPVLIIPKFKFPGVVLFQLS